MLRRENAGLKLNQLLGCRTCQSLGGTPCRRIARWAFCGQVFQAYVTLNLSTSWDPSVLWNTVWEPLREFRTQGKHLWQLLEDKGP